MTFSELLTLIDELDMNIDVSSFSEDKSFSEQGLDSLDLVNLFFEIEEKYDTKIPEDRVGDLNSPKSLLAFVNSK